MIIALDEAQKAFDEDEVPVGACVVDGSSGEVIARAHNLTERAHDPSAHAEILALRAACIALGSARIPNFDLYVTLEPCPMCAAAISFARISRVYFGAYDVKGGAIDHGARLYTNQGNLYLPETYGGIEESRCSALLKEFFKGKR